MMNEGAPLKTGRIYTMDELRGLAVFCMIFYHGFYTVGYLFGNFWGRFFFQFFTPAEPFFAGLFMFISGIACNLSHSNLARGLKLFAIAMGVTLVTAVAVPDNIITFGILHFLSVCMILAGLLKPAIDRCRSIWIPVAVCVFLYIFTMNIQYGYFGPGGMLKLMLPQGLYSTNWLAPLGFHNEDFMSADYFPMLPWIFVYAAGIFVGKLAKAGKFPKALYKSRVPVFGWMGRHALILYIVHQPVIYGVCLLIQALVSHG
jgi:uncharacterized membrane protein